MRTGHSAWNVRTRRIPIFSITRHEPTLTDIVEACERHHVKLAIAHQTRYSPRLQRVRELIAYGLIGDILELRGRGKEDARVGGQDLMVLGKHIMDLMRFLAGDARWCYARVGVVEKDRVRPATKADIREGGEGMGPIAGDHITAMYGFDKGRQFVAVFHPARIPGAGQEAWRQKPIEVRFSTAPGVVARSTTRRKKLWAISWVRSRSRFLVNTVGTHTGSSMSIPTNQRNSRL